MKHIIKVNGGVAWWHHKRLAKCQRVYLSVNILWYGVNTLVFRNHTNNPDISPCKLWFFFLTKAMVCPRITSIKQLFSLTQLFKTITITDTTNPLVFLIRHSNGRSPTLANGHAWKVTGETVSTLANDNVWKVTWETVSDMSLCH